VIGADPNARSHSSLLGPMDGFPGGGPISAIKSFQRASDTRPASGPARYRSASARLALRASSASIGAISFSQAPRISATVGNHWLRLAIPERGSVTFSAIASGYVESTAATAAE
jgi:hypothetical protein